MPGRHADHPPIGRQPIPTLPGEKTSVSPASGMAACETSSVCRPRIADANTFTRSLGWRKRTKPHHSSPCGVEIYLLGFNYSDRNALSRQIVPRA